MSKTTITKNLPVLPLRRLSTTQYQNTIRDLFGATLYIKAAPKCPANETGDYTLGTVDDKVLCPNVGTEATHTLGTSY